MEMGHEEIVQRLLEKSKEAFILALELYNRPTLKYHAESCSIFLCNAVMSIEFLDKESSHLLDKESGHFLD
ncbi:DUF3644 domain-containing protein, partial [Corynebacterium coyleae]|uniref:DUF3644 domain-containing protein n=1 Tax=Corynebacterium coyleae TaxID=53374 RepID=UPI0030146C03|nr:hypothetical protein [Corynebacterium coyleae]